ncbi:MAG: Rab family GTPase [Promethearchaeota archaeon]
MEQVEKLKFKLCVLGDPSVGKTSLIHSYVDGFFRQSYLSTIGVAFLTKTVNLEIKGKPTNVVLQIWDVGGQSIFSQIRSNYLRGSQGAFILFDVTNKSTLMHIDAWIDELMRALRLKDLSKIPILVIGNKIDLKYDERLKDIAKQYLKNQFNISFPITYTSAKTGEGMIEAFEFITKLMIKTIRED